MGGKELHSWDVSIAEAKQIQLTLAERVSRINSVSKPHYIAGVDISTDKRQGKATAAVVLLSYPGLNIVETQVVHGELHFPYVPGLLSFREAPLMLAAFERLAVAPELVLVDGQGIAHPRRIGLASHLGLMLDIPAIGCAKSLLCGTYQIPGDKSGDFTGILDGDEVIGAVLRTKNGVKPIFVSIGHKIDLEAAITWVLRCCRGYRLPEPTRLAHMAAGGSLRQVIKAVATGTGCN